MLCVQVSPNFIPSLTFFFNNLSNAKVKHYAVSNKKMNKKSNSIKLLCPRKLEKTNSRFHYKTVFKEIWYFVMYVQKTDSIALVPESVLEWWDGKNNTSFHFHVVTGREDV